MDSAASTRSILVEASARRPAESDDTWPGFWAPRQGMSAWWIPPTLRNYRALWLSADALAGLTLVAVALPSQMATARLADLPAVDGLYACIAGTLLFAIFGTNRRLSVGADSTIAPVLAVGVASVAVAGTARYGTNHGLCCLAGRCRTHRRRPLPPPECSLDFSLTGPRYRSRDNPCQFPDGFPH
jgi:hypothetical protein